MVVLKGCRCTCAFGVAPCSVGGRGRGQLELAFVNAVNVLRCRLGRAAREVRSAYVCRAAERRGRHEWLVVRGVRGFISLGSVGAVRRADAIPGLAWVVRVGWPVLAKLGTTCAECSHSLQRGVSMCTMVWASVLRLQLQRHCGCGRPVLPLRGGAAAQVGSRRDVGVSRLQPRA